MNWDALGAISEIVGAGGVIVTLVYLAVQVRHNTSAVRSSTHQTQIDSTVPLNGAIAADGNLAALIAKANQDYESLAPGEQIQLQFMYVNYFNLWHSAFWNHKENLVPHQAWRLWNNGMVGLLTEQIACRIAWEGIRTMYDEAFQTHVDKLIDTVNYDDDVGSGIPLVTKNVT